MDMDAFIADQNLIRFRELLRRETDPLNRRLLEQLIGEELGKLGLQNNRSAAAPPRH